MQGQRFNYTFSQQDQLHIDPAKETTLTQQKKTQEESHSLPLFKSESFTPMQGTLYSEYNTLANPSGSINQSGGDHHPTNPQKPKEPRLFASTTNSQHK
jgi:hypothetical protein